MCGHQQMKLQHDLVLVLINYPLSLSLPLSSWIRRSIYDSQGPGGERDRAGSSIDYIYHHQNQIMLAASPTRGAPLYIPSRLIQTEEGGRRASYPRERERVERWRERGMN